MDDMKLQQLVEEISLNYFHKPFNHQVTFNKRLRTTGGRYLLRSHNIDINPKYYIEHGLEEIIGIIKHELCHYHLHLEGKGYKHGDKDFKDLLKEVGAPRFCKPLKKEIKSNSAPLIYKCKSCSLIYKRKRKVDTTRLVCGKCGGKIYLYKKG
ncbi:SprT family protein [Metabacillus sediminilitoris]|uniref:Protein SprT-like n=1 Tax=Metabacillus sediminilitoris TaxID=2567941 RepID=A0A4S4BKX2_9BACI|nr:SprT family protein [Metabacillus sediminilitoris]QGQ44086.1 SprT family protein [Metabacillus sediminilitoris]THF75400.1 SprT family protein [Metabacillus sediminilitoris]